MFEDFFNTQTLILFVFFIISVTLHGLAQTWAASRFGDKTAVKQGRLTINPVAHFELTGLVVFFFLHTGWAKPIPVAEETLDRSAKIKIALIGPITHMSIAFLLTLMVGLATWLATKDNFTLLNYSAILQMGIRLNVGMALINLIPVPPLDAFAIFKTILPRTKQAQEIYHALPYIISALLVISLIFGYGTIGDTIRQLANSGSDYLYLFVLKLFYLI